MIPEWCLGIRLMNLLTPGQWSISLLDHIYPAFISRVSILTCFPLEPCCDNNSFLDQAVEDMSMVLILSSWTLSTYQNWLHPLRRLILYHSSICSGFLCLVSTVSDTCRPQLLTSNHKLWCLARALFLDSRLLCYLIISH